MSEFSAELIFISLTLPLQDGANVDDSYLVEQIRTLRKLENLYEDAYQLMLGKNMEGLNWPILNLFPNKVAINIYVSPLMKNKVDNYV